MSEGATLLTLSLAVALLLLMTFLIFALLRAVSRKSRALARSEERLRQLFERNPAAIWRSTDGGNVLECNEAFVRLLGYSSRDEVLYASLWDHYPSTEEREAVLGMLLEKGNITNHEVCLQRKDGGAAWVLENVNLLREEGQPDILEGTYVDITGRRRAEERMGRLNDCLLSLGPDTDGNISRLTSMWGEAVGATCALYNRLEGPLLCSVGQWMTPSDYQARDQAEGHICFDVIRRGSEEVTLVRNLQETPYASSDPNVARYGLRTYLGRAVKFSGECKGSLCAVYTTDFVPTEDDLRLLGIIASAIGVEEELRRAREALLRAKTLEAIGLVAGGVAHEVRNPLFSLSTLSAALEKKLVGDPQVKPFLDLIQAQVKRLSALMDDLLDLGKPIEASQFVTCSLQDILSDSVRIVGAGPQGDRIPVHISAPRTPVFTRGIPTKLTQIFVNLVQNARHFSEPGDEIHVTVQPEARSVLITVTDTGPGIPPEILPHLFEPFTSRREGGTGLGLSIVRKIAESHGGAIWAENRSESPGAVFSVRLPLEEKP